MRLEIKHTYGLTNITEDAKGIRESVFVQEQGISPDLEFDDQDSNGIHYVGYGTDTDQPITTARIHLQDNLWHVGRVATVKEMRGQRFGKTLLEQIIKDAQNVPEIHVVGLTLGAQVQASDFYKRLGFVQVGDIFQEAGIPHIEMVLVFNAKIAN